MDVRLGEKIQLLRKNLGYTQKEFAEFLSIPQPSLSAYENDRNSPTTEVLINIATKCKVSLDWLCGISTTENTKYHINEMSDLTELLYTFMELNEIGIDIEVNDRLPNDIETDEEKWYTKLTVYGNDKRFKYNSTLCKIITSIRDNLLDLETYAIDKEVYDMRKAKKKDYLKDLILTKKIFPDLSREERMKKYREWLSGKE
ncbi:helix-turn-helix protein [anaerobic digester metagenome]